MASSVVKNPNMIKGWAYIGSTTGNERITIPDSLYKEILCMVYFENNASNVFTFHEPCSYTDERTYRQSYYDSASSYMKVAIHSNKSGEWWGWVFYKNTSDVMSTTKSYWFAR